MIPDSAKATIADKTRRDCSQILSTVCAAPNENTCTNCNILFRGGGWSERGVGGGGVSRRMTNNDKFALNSDDIKVALTEGKLFSIDDTAKGGLTKFQQLFTVTPCATKDFKR